MVVGIVLIICIKSVLFLWCCLLRRMCWVGILFLVNFYKFIVIYCCKKSVLVFIEKWIRYCVVLVNIGIFWVYFFMCFVLVKFENGIL